MTQTVWLHGTALVGVPLGDPAPGLRPALPGHGGRRRAGATVADLAAALEPDLPDRFALVGHSLGGMIALHLAVTLPQRCRALVLVDAPLWIPRWLLPRTAALLAPVSMHVLGRWITAAIVGARTDNPAIRPKVRASIRGMSTMGLARATQAACRFDGCPLVDHLTVPTLALFGETSPLTTRRMQAALSARPSVTCETWRAGHMLPYEEPDRFRATTAAFLDRHP